MDYDAQALDAQIQALLKQNEASMAMLNELQNSSITDTLQTQGIDVDKYTAWIRSQIAPDDLADIDRAVARQMDELEKEVASFKAAATPKTQGTRRRNMV